MRWDATLVIATILAAGHGAAMAASDEDVAAIVARHMDEVMSDGPPSGLSVAVRIDGRTLFYNFGYADMTTKKPVTTDTLFNLGSVSKVFDATLLAQAAAQGELALDDPVAKYVTELNEGGDVRRITLRQLASHSSGFVLPQDHPPWPDQTFTLPEFIAYLKAWKSDAEHQPGRQMIYAHSGYILLHIALERKFGAPFHDIMDARILKPLGLSSTTLPLPDADTQDYPRGRIPPDFARRAVQGYDAEGTAVGEQGNLQGYYHWLGTGQMFSSARDMAVFLIANLDELPDHRPLQDAMALTHRPVIPINADTLQSMAWEVLPKRSNLVQKYGGLDNASAFIAMVPGRKLGIVILGNRGSLPIPAAGAAVLHDLAAD